ncbi:hypothetical protein AGMMS50256_24030 [Betaproteobacteria bacterium]|nr:hypothetical protein AGMMS50256_24030 [Betaproteobacteria bacterium]
MRRIRAVICDCRDALRFPNLQLLLRGPNAEDRILALDALYIDGMLTMLTLGIGFGSSAYFGIALVIALFGFVGSSAMAKFLLRGEVIEP